MPRFQVKSARPHLSRRAQPHRAARGTLDRCTRTGAGQAVPILAAAALVVLGSTRQWENAEATWNAYAPLLQAATPTELPRLAFAAAANAADSGDDSALVTRVELARTIAASLNREIEVAIADTWLAAIALLAGDTVRADRLAGRLVERETPLGRDHDLVAPAREGPAQQRLAMAGPVAARGVIEINT